MSESIPKDLMSVSDFRTRQTLKLNRELTNCLHAIKTAMARGDTSVTCPSSGDSNVVVKIEDALKSQGFKVGVYSKHNKHEIVWA